MLTFKIVYFILCLACVTPLEKECNLDENNRNCPQNSICGNQGFCICEKGWILDCKTAAIPIKTNSPPSPFTLKGSKQQIFSITPNSFQKLSVYQFKVCMNKSQNINLSLKLWYDDGKQNQLGEKNKIKQMISVVNKTCTYLGTRTIVLQHQKNGEPDLMVLSVSVHSNSTEDEKNREMNLYALEIEGMDIGIFYTIYLVVGVICSSILGASLILCIYYGCRIRRAHQKRNKKNCIKHLDKHFPKTSFKNLELTSEDLVCSVCLQEFSGKQKVRKTFCNHIFHSQCIDSWCKLKLTCPLCRVGLDEELLKTIEATKEENSQENCSTQLGKISIREGLINAQQQ